MKKNLFSLLYAFALFSAILALQACTAENEPEEDNGGQQTETCEELSIYADQTTAQYVGMECSSWTLDIFADGNPPEWIQTDDYSGSSKINITFTARPNTSGESRFASFQIVTTSAAGTTDNITLNITQSAEAANGRNMKISLTDRIIAGYPTYVYSPTFDFSKNPLTIELGRTLLEARTINEHNAVFTTPADLRGQYEMTVRIGTEKYNFGTGTVYTPEQGSTMFLTVPPVLFEANGANLLATFNISNNPQTLAFDAEGNKVTPYFTCSDGSICGTDALTRIQSITPRFINGRVIIADDALGNSPRYDDDNFTVSTAGMTSHNIIIDTQTSVCHILNTSDSFENIVWTTNDFHNSGRTAFTGIPNGSKQGYRIELSSLDKEQVLQQINNNPGLACVASVKMLDGAVFTEYYPQICAVADEILIDRNKIWVDGQVTEEAAHPAVRMYHFDESDINTSMNKIPVYPCGALYRVVNYAAKSSTGTRWMHEMAIAPMTSSNAVVHEIWDNQSSARKTFEVYATPAGTYLRPIIPDNADFTSVKAYMLNASEATAYELSNAELKYCQPLYGVSGSELLFENQFPYVGKYRYNQTDNGIITASPYDRYEDPIELSGSSAPIINAQLLSDGVIFAHANSDGTVSFLRYREGQTSPARTITVKPSDLIGHMTDFGGWMAAF